MKVFVAPTDPSIAQTGADHQSSAYSRTVGARSSKFIGARGGTLT
jgi:hypothetical protein